MPWHTKSTLVAYLVLPRPREQGGTELLLWQKIDDGTLLLPHAEPLPFETPTEAVCRLGRVSLNVDIPEERLEQAYMVFCPSDGEDTLHHLALFFLCPIIGQDGVLWSGTPRVASLSMAKEPVWYCSRNPRPNEYRSLGAVERNFFREIRTGRRYFQLPSAREDIGSVI